MPPTAFFVLSYFFRISLGEGGGGGGSIHKAPSGSDTIFLPRGVLAQTNKCSTGHIIFQCCELQVFLLHSRTQPYHHASNRRGTSRSLQHVCYLVYTTYQRCKKTWTILPSYECEAQFQRLAHQRLKVRLAQIFGSTRAKSGSIRWCVVAWQRTSKFTQPPGLIKE